MFEDLKFVPLMCVTLGFGSGIPLSSAILHGLAKGTSPNGTKEHSLICRGIRGIELGAIMERRNLVLQLMGKHGT